jgi:hypothetical protein
VQRDLEHSPELRATLHEIKALHGLLQSTVDASAQHALKPFFTDRVMRRLTPIPQKLTAASQDEEFFAFLLRLFRPVALAGILLILGFATYNVAFSDAYVAETTATEAMLGLPPVTLTTAYTLDFETIPPIEP